jgi:intein/homing endonuclease
MSINLNISDQINHQYRTYALYVLQSRGIPNFYDALTPVQRLILENSPGKFNKTIGLVGEVIKTGLYHHGDCFDGETLINLADGTSIKIKDWYTDNPDDDLLVRSFDTDSGKEVIGYAHSPRIGQINNEYLEIELESGEVIKCTDNHPFLVNGEWIKAGDLIPGQDIKNL